MPASEVLYGLLSAGYHLRLPIHTDLSDDVVSQVDEIKGKVISGEIAVPASQEEFEAAYGDVYELD